MNTASISKTAAGRALLILTAGSAAVFAIVAAPAIPASAGSSAVATIGQLEAQGFDVRVNRLGSSPLDQCVVTDIGKPRDRTELVRVNGHGDHDFVPVVVRRTITVSLNCSR